MQAAIIMVFLVFLYAAVIHPFHLSVTNIYYKEKEKVVQVEQRLFLDDLEAALRDFTGYENFNITEADPQIRNEIVSKYLTEKFTITSKGKKLDLAYLGNEIELQENVMWCYFEAEKVKKFEAFSVENSLLVEKFEDQENIIHYTFPSGKKLSERTSISKTLVNFGD